MLEPFRDINRFCRKHKLGLLFLILLVFIPIIFIIFRDCVEDIAKHFELTSWFIGKIDDYIVRVFGIVLLIATGYVFLRDGVFGSSDKPEDGGSDQDEDKHSSKNGENANGPTSESKRSNASSKSHRIFGRDKLLLLKLAAGLGASGAALLGSYTLDELDGGKFKWPDLPSSPPAATGAASTAGAEPTGPTAGQGTYADQSAGMVLARWLQVVPADENCWIEALADGVPDTGNKSPKACPYKFSIRAVVRPGEACPEVELHGRTAGEATQARLQLFMRQNRDPEHYPINLCEGYIASDSNVAEIRFDDERSIRLPQAWFLTAGPEYIVTVGDTGCRDNRDQDCAGLNWPFDDLVEQLTAGTMPDRSTKHPDLLIHLGDFIYGGGDHWTAWWHEFFQPAAPLLESTPWIMLRGNHEGCGADAPRGWLFLFDVRPDGDTDTCASTDASHLVATYAIDLGDRLRIVVADSSNAFANDPCRILRGDKCANGDTESNPDKIDKRDRAGLERFQKVLRTVGWLSTGAGRETWLATHVPIIGLAHNGKKATPDNIVPQSTAMMAAAWHGVAGQINLPNVILSGDLHFFQVSYPVKGKDHGLEFVVDESDVVRITRSKQQMTAPLQLTIGTGGVNPDKLPKAIVVDRRDRIVGQVADTLTLPGAFAKTWWACTFSGYGYLWAEREGKDYAFSYHRIGANRINPGTEVCVDVTDDEAQPQD